MNEKILVGTYHKTGTNLLNSVFRDFAERTGKNFINISMQESAEGYNILFSHESNFNKYDYPAIHVIRDPRDITISGERYHILGAEKTKEEWLNGGYSDKLRSIKDYGDRLLYEAEVSTKWTCSQIIKNLNKGYLMIKYEYLYLDIENDFEYISSISEHFSMSEEERKVFKESFIKNHPKNIGKDFVHIHNGGIEQYKNLDPSVLEALNTMLSDEISLLGYL